MNSKNHNFNILQTDSVVDGHEDRGTGGDKQYESILLLPINAELLASGCVKREEVDIDPIGFSCLDPVL